MLNVFVLFNFSSTISFLFHFFFRLISIHCSFIIISGDVSRRMPNNFLSFSLFLHIPPTIMYHNDRFNWANILPFFLHSSIMNHEQWAMSYTNNEYDIFVYVNAFCYRNAGLISCPFLGSAVDFFYVPHPNNLGTHFSFISPDFIYSVSPPFLTYNDRFWFRFHFSTFFVFYLVCGTETMKVKMRQKHEKPQYYKKKKHISIKHTLNAPCQITHEK